MHLDLKPENIVCTDILDNGINRLKVSLLAQICSHNNVTSLQSNDKREILYRTTRFQIFQIVDFGFAQRLSDESGKKIVIILIPTHY